MHDYNHKNQRLKNRNRPKKQKKPRKPINFRRFLKKGGRAFLFVGGICLLAFLGQKGYDFLARTTFFKLEKIQVSGVKKLTRKEVIALSGLKPGDPMLHLKLAGVADHVKKSPWVEKVRVNRYFPRTVSIEITEWVPAAIVNMGYLFYLDGKGEIFKPLSQGDNLDFPVITGILEEDLAKDPKGSREMLKTALQVAGLLRSGGALKLQDISEIHVGKGYGCTLFTARGGVPIKLGNDGFQEKLARLARIYGDLSQQLAMVEYIDLNYSDKIVVKKV